MTNKTRKNINKNKNIDVKNASLIKCKLKTCRANLYKSVYGSARGGNIRSERQLFY